MGVYQYVRYITGKWFFKVFRWTGVPKAHAEVMKIKRWAKCIKGDTYFWSLDYFFRLKRQDTPICIKSISDFGIWVFSIQKPKYQVQMERFGIMQWKYFWNNQRNMVLILAENTTRIRGYLVNSDYYGLYGQITSHWRGTWKTLMRFHVPLFRVSSR